MAARGLYTTVVCHYRGCVIQNVSIFYCIMNDAVYLVTICNFLLVFSYYVSTDPEKKLTWFRNDCVLTDNLM